MNLINPLAQTFVTDLKGGIFATSLALYFFDKDDTEPVQVQLRAVENGIPTGQVLPFSDAIVAASAVLTSDDASLPTNFTFQAPVYLQQNVEYAFTVTSNSDKYALWVSEMGGTDVFTPSFTITKQPNSGVMYKMSNGAVWTPDQTKDIKFVLRRAAFSQSGSVVFSEGSIPPVTLESNPLYTTSGSKVIRVYHQNNGHFPGTSQVTISGVTSAVNGIPASEINNVTFTVQTVEADWYTIQVPTTNATSTGRSGGDAVTATENRPFDVVHPLVTQIALPDTVADWKAKMTTGKSLAGTETPHVVEDYVSIKVNDNNYLKRPHTIVSAPNRTLLSSGDRSFTLKSEMSTLRNNISPVVDLGRLSVATIANRVDNPSSSVLSGYNQVANYVPETASRYSSALSKYITKRIDLNDPASAIKVYVSINRPTGSYINLYYKVLPKGSDANFEDLAWVAMPPDAAVPITDDAKNYSEVQYSVNETALGNVEFSSFAIKIVFTSENSSAVATCKDFRAIAVT